MIDRFDTPENQRQWTEAKLERECGVRVRDCDGDFYKFTSPNRRSVPDRLIVLPNNILFFVEFKAWGKKPTDGQIREIQRLQRRDAKVYVVDNLIDFTTLIDAALAGYWPAFDVIAPPGVEV